MSQQGKFFVKRKVEYGKRLRIKKDIHIIYRNKVNVDKMYASYNNRRLWLEGCIENKNLTEKEGGFMTKSTHDVTNKYGSQKVKKNLNKV